jgi:hypothetical protein
MTALAARTHLILRHDEVLGRGRSRLHASVTQIDLHDFSRLACTYGLAGFHCVSAMESQHRICQDIAEYWRAGFGRSYNPDRHQALALLQLHRSQQECLTSIENHHGAPAFLVGTSAQDSATSWDLADLLHLLPPARPLALQFGTSWGLSPEQLQACQGVLRPIQSQAPYNHLSVRCAAAILVDRLFAKN